MTPLRRRMIDDMTLHGLKPKTIQAYVACIARFARHFGKSPKLLGTAEIRSYLLYLTHDRHVASSTYNQALCALKFLYRITLKRDWGLDGLARTRRQTKLPVVLSLEEVNRFFQAITSIRHRAILMTAYAAGLRISEVLALRVDDIDSQRMVIRIRQAKGSKDRYVMLSPRLLTLLREYWRAHRRHKVDPPSPWLFPGNVARSAALRQARVWSLPGGVPRRGAGQTRHCAHAQAQLRHPPAGGRHRPADHPDPAGPSQPQHHRSIPPCGHRGLAIDPQSAGSPGPAVRGGPSVMTRPRPTVAEVIRSCLDEFLERYGPELTPEQRRALNDLVSCRTAALGGHVLGCPECGHQQIAYNSCGNRHCPTCQATAAARWLEARAAELLPVPYFHLVFTLPDALDPIALANPRVVYDLLLRSAAETVLEVAADPKLLGAQTGVLAVLHTWGQNLQFHPHVHCVVPGGGLSPDGTRWVASASNFFLPVRVLSRVFRGKFLAGLRAAFAKGELRFAADQFEQALSAAVHTDWVVYAKPPFGGPEQVLKYLARYTHRVAISNARLLDFEDGMVRFRYKDYAHGNRKRVMTLTALEFVRRLLP